MALTLNSVYGNGSDLDFPQNIFIELISGRNQQRSGGSSITACLFNNADSRAAPFEERWDQGTGIFLSLQSS